MEEIYDIAVQFPSPVVQRYAAMLRDSEVTLDSFSRPTIIDELVTCGIPRIPAGNIVDEFKKHYNRGPVGVFWDMENVGLPQGIRTLDAVTALRNKLLKTFGEITEFKAYIDLAIYTAKFDAPTRVALQDAGLQIVDAAHNNRKEVADKMIIVDALWFALQTPNSTVCIISSDSDFSPLLSKLRMKGVRTLIITADAQRVRSLREQANFALRWPSDFIADATLVPSGPQRNRSNSGRAVSPKSKPLGTTPSITVEPSSPAAATHESQSHEPPQPLIPTVTPSSAQRTGGGKYDDLIECIKAAQREIGGKKARRSMVGFMLRQINPVTNFRELVQDAVIDNVVKIGGHLGEAWIALESDDAKETEDDVMMRREASSADFPVAVSVLSALQGRTNTPLSTATTAPGEEAQAADEAKPWFLTLRYSRKYQAYQTLEAFVAPAGLTLQRMQEAGTGFFRIAIGPFPSAVSADNFFQLHFGHLKLTPRVTRCPQLKQNCPEEKHSKTHSAGPDAKKDDSAKQAEQPK